VPNDGRSSPRGHNLESTPQATPKTANHHGLHLGLNEVLHCRLCLSGKQPAFLATITKRFAYYQTPGLRGVDLCLVQSSTKVARWSENSKFRLPDGRPFSHFSTPYHRDGMMLHGFRLSQSAR
jgi:hypothetical protein